MLVPAAHDQPARDVLNTKSKTQQGRVSVPVAVGNVQSSSPGYVASPPGAATLMTEVP
jgi:hypothetical protein